MSDTPRTDVLLIAHDMSPTHILLISHSRELERELNSANQIIRQQQLLEEDNLRLTAKVAQLYEGAEEQEQRIKRLENIISRASTSFFEDGSDRVVAVAMLMILDEAKEAKP